MTTKVINFFAGPGAGKSTLAAGLFYHMKQKGVNVELVREYAKDVVWEGRDHLLENQIYIFAKQLKRMRDLEGKVDYIITDSPLLFSVVYSKNMSSSFIALVRQEFNRFTNINLRVVRAADRVYNPAGRLQSEAEAISIDKAIEAELTGYSVQQVSTNFSPEMLSEIVRMCTI